MGFIGPSIKYVDAFPYRFKLTLISPQQVYFGFFRNME